MEQSSHKKYLMKTVIAVKIRARNGHNSAIERTVKWLKDEYSATELKPETNVDPNDCTILRTKEKLIGICNQGNRNGAFEDDLQLLYDRNCNIIVCAGRDISKTFDCIEHYRDEHYSNDPFRIYEVSVSTTNQVKKFLHEMV